MAMKKGADALKGIHSNLCVCLKLINSCKTQCLCSFQYCRRCRCHNGQDQGANGPYQRDFRCHFQPRGHGYCSRRGKIAVCVFWVCADPLGVRMISKKNWTLSNKNSLTTGLRGQTVCRVTFLHLPLSKRPAVSPSFIVRPLAWESLTVTTS